MTESGGTGRPRVAWMLWGLSFGSAITAVGLVIAVWVVRTPAGMTGTAVSWTSGEPVSASIGAAAALVISAVIGGCMAYRRRAAVLAWVLTMVMVIAPLSLGKVRPEGVMSRTGQLVDTAEFPRAFDLPPVITAVWVLIAAAVVLAFVAALDADLLRHSESPRHRWAWAVGVVVPLVVIPLAVAGVERKGPDPAALAGVADAPPIPTDSSITNARIINLPALPDSSFDSTSRRTKLIPTGPGYLIEDESGIHVYNGEDGTHRWTRNPSDFGCDHRETTSLGGTSSRASIIVHCAVAPGYTIAFDAFTGEHLWTSDRIASPVDIPWTSPVLLALSDGIVGVDIRTGETSWRGDRADPCTDGEFNVAVAGDHVVSTETCRRGDDLCLGRRLRSVEEASAGPGHRAERGLSDIRT